MLSLNMEEDSPHGSLSRSGTIAPEGGILHRTTNRTAAFKVMRRSRSWMFGDLDNFAPFRPCFHTAVVGSTRAGSTYVFVTSMRETPHPRGSLPSC